MTTAAIIGNIASAIIIVLVLVGLWKASREAKAQLKALSRDWHDAVERGQ